MSFLISLVLPLVVCVGLVGVTSVMWWSGLQSPWLYVLFALLSTLGLHRVVQAVAELIKIFTQGGYFLEAREKPSAYQLAVESMTTEAVAISLVVLLAGVPLLHWLRSAMQRL